MCLLVFYCTLDFFSLLPGDRVREYTWNVSHLHKKNKEIESDKIVSLCKYSKKINGFPKGHSFMYSWLMIYIQY